MEELLEVLEGTANLLRGMTMDPMIPSHAKTAMRERAALIDKLVEEHTDA